MGRIFQ